MAFLFSRIANRSALVSLSKFPNVLGTAQYAQMAAGVPKITLKKFEPPKPEHYEVKNERLRRPLSPHLTIYSPQLTSMLSISHRIAGMMLSGYISALGIGALVLPNDVSHYVNIIDGLNLSPATLFLTKAVIAAPFAYHLANGIRHLYWDTARGLTIREVYKTGYTMLAVSTVLTIIFAVL